MKTKGLERMSKLMYIVSCFLQNNQYYITVSCCSSALALYGGREGGGLVGVEGGGLVGGGEVGRLASVGMNGS